MKNLINTSAKSSLRAIFSLMLVAVLSFGFNPAKADSTDGAPKIELHTAVDQLIGYPVLSSDMILNGTVNITFKISKDLKLEVLKVSGDNEFLNFYVEKSLEGQDVNVDASLAGSMFSTKVSFNH